MNTTEISDAEAHALVLERFENMTREEAQGWLDHVAQVFGRDAAPVGATSLNGSVKRSTKSRNKSTPKAARIAANS